MSLCFLTVRFPLALLGDDCLESHQDISPFHEKRGHAFYQTDQQVVADKLLELYRHGKPDPARWDPTALIHRTVEKLRRGEQAKLLLTPIFEIVNVEDLDLAQRVTFRQEVQQLQQIAPVKFLESEGLAFLGLNHDRRTMLLLHHYAQACQWEPLVREELVAGENACAAGRNSLADARGLGLTINAQHARERVWIWALRPLERDHTPNMCCFVGDAAGSIVQMLHNERTRAVIPECLASNSALPISKTRQRRTLAEMRDNAPPAGGWSIWYRYYRPSEKDISILKAAYPEDDSHNPNWLNVKRDLVCAGQQAEILAKTEAPVLLGLLARLQAAHAVMPTDGAMQRTFGALLKAVESSECAYRQNIAVAQKEQQSSGSGAARWWRTQAEILRFRPDPKEWPGVNYLEAICQAEFGGGPEIAGCDVSMFRWSGDNTPVVPSGSVSGLTADHLRRVRGMLVIQQGIPPTEVDNMTLGQVVGAYQRRREGARGDGPDGGRLECEGAVMKRGDRRSLPPDDEAKILEKCRRRCCVCFMLDRDTSEKKGQLAHLDHNRSNNAISNFVFLCLFHHDTYDSKTSQAKNLTEREVRLYQAKLHEAVERGDVPLKQAGATREVPINKQVRLILKVMAMWWLGAM